MVREHLSWTKFLGARRKCQLNRTVKLLLFELCLNIILYFQSNIESFLHRLFQYIIRYTSSNPTKTHCLLLNWQWHCSSTILYFVIKCLHDFYVCPLDSGQWNNSVWAVSVSSLVLYTMLVCYNTHRQIHQEKCPQCRCFVCRGFCLPLCKHQNRKL